jgi:subtilisin-like proprotein convertase family protein
MAAGVIACGLLAVVTASQADTDSRSISVPLIGTRGAASVYPSTVIINPIAGPTQTGPVTVILHRVTHPCPEHLAVLLVHNAPGGGNFLLMSNAGGCRPLQGTDIAFSATEPALPDDEPVNPPHGNLLEIGASNYGAVPAFPSPAPAGLYTLGMPPANGSIAGAWNLYVFDTTEGERGVIAGGWSLQYDDMIRTVSASTNVAVPANGTAGAAAHYPINFDLSGAREDARVDFVGLAIALTHANTDDLRIVLQSPGGTAVAVMINAGGPNPLAPGTTLTFSDFASGPVAPDNAQMITGFYKPGGVYGAALLPLPAPAGPYQTTFAAFNGEHVPGVWRLWVYDGKFSDVGTINSVTLFVGTHSAPQVTQLSPPNATQVTEPFVRVQGQITDAIAGPSTAYSATWRVTTGVSDFYAAGSFTFRSGTNAFFADVPVKLGINNVMVTVQDPHGNASVQNRAINVEEFTYALAEGSTGGFFDTDVTIGNLSNAAAPLSIEFLSESGSTVTHADQVAANAPRQLHVDQFVPADAVSTIVHSTNAVPLAVERTMSWDSRGYGGHGGGATAPASDWLFAEGSQGYFSTYLLLANGGTIDANVTVRFLLEGGGGVLHALTVPPQSRRTIDAGSIPELVNRSFGIHVLSSRPIIAERSMYFPFGSPRLWEGGHESAGVNETSRNWFLAEGATGPFFETFILLMNPTDIPANVTLTYLLPSGDTVTQTTALAAFSRQTINVETIDPKLINAAVSTRVTSDVGIVVERAMYWPDISQGWREAHNSFGVTELGLRWGLADGRLGGPRGYETYILLANPNAMPSEVRVRLTKPGVSVTRQYTLPPTSRLNVWTSHDVPEIGEGVFAVEVEVLNFVPIAVEKAMYWNSDGEIWAAGTNVTATRLPPP